MLGEQGIWGIPPFIFFQDGCAASQERSWCRRRSRRNGMFNEIWTDVKCTKRRDIEMKGYQDWMFDHGIMAQHTKEELSCFCCRPRSAPVPWLSPEFMEDTASTAVTASMAPTQWFLLENGFKNQPMLHPPRKQTWRLEIDTRKRRFLLETIPSVFKLNLRLCTNPWVFNRPYDTNPSFASTCFVWPAVLWTSETDYGVFRAQLWPRLRWVTSKMGWFRFQKIAGPKSIQRWNKVTKSVGVFFFEDVLVFCFFLRESAHVAARILGSVKEGSWW